MNLDVKSWCKRGCEGIYIPDCIPCSIRCPIFHMDVEQWMYSINADGLVGFISIRSHRKGPQICNPYLFGYVWKCLVNTSYEQSVFGNFGDTPDGISISLMMVQRFREAMYRFGHVFNSFGGFVE